MFGTITLQVDSILMWLMVIAMAGVMLFIIRKVEKRKAARYEAEHAARQAEYAERELKQKRDHQLNHGREVFNKLAHQLKQYRELGVKVWKKEDNGTGFTIFITRESTAVMQGYVPILQLTYDFGRYPAPYQGHIHYGSYGPDILIWVGDHVRMHGLDQLVVKPVLEEVERLKELKAKMAS
jgi:hypothetical protein